MYIQMCPVDVRHYLHLFFPLRSHIGQNPMIKTLCQCIKVPRTTTHVTGCNFSESSSKNEFLLTLSVSVSPTSSSCCIISMD